MKNLLRSTLYGVSVCLIGATIVHAQDWKTADTLPGVDLSKLTATQKASALKILRTQGCSCGCSMKMAECRVVDPGCAYSTGLAAAIVNTLAQGKSADEALKVAGASKWAHVQQEQKLLSDPVNIPVAGAPTTGPAKAPITLVEFSDFQCPYCAEAVPQIAAILKAYPTQIKLIFKQYPLEIHPQADLAAAAAVAAQKQGKFWQMHDALFSNHDDLSRQHILALAKQNGLDLKRFEDDLDSTSVREAVVRDVEDGNDANVEGTPTIFINGQRYNGAISLGALKPVFEAELKPSAAQTASAKAASN